MSLNWTVMAYIGFGGSGGGTTVIVNENGLTPIQEVDFELEEVRGDVEMQQVLEFTIIYEAAEEFTLFLDEVS